MGTFSMDGAKGSITCISTATNQQMWEANHWLLTYKIGIGFINFIYFLKIPTT